MIQPGIDMIAVEWFDATYLESLSRHKASAVDTRLVNMITIGFLAAATEDAISIGHEWAAEQETFRGLTIIPKVNIIRQHRWKLRWPKMP